MSIKHIVAAVLHAITPHHATRTAFNGHTLSVMLHVPKGYHPPKLTTQQRERALALTIFGEARSLGPSGMRAVGFVILNRVREGKAKFGDYHIDNVVWARKQFSCWNGRDPNRVKLGHIAKAQADKLDHIRWEQAKMIAHRLIHGTAGRDPTGGATLYHTKTILPYWVVHARQRFVTVRANQRVEVIHTLRRTGLIGSHVFYRAVTTTITVRRHVA